MFADHGLFQGVRHVGSLDQFWRDGLHVSQRKALLAVFAACSARGSSLLSLLLGPFVSTPVHDMGVISPKFCVFGPSEPGGIEEVGSLPVESQVVDSKSPREPENRRDGNAFEARARWIGGVAFGRRSHYFISTCSILLLLRGPLRVWV